MTEKQNQSGARNATKKRTTRRTQSRVAHEDQRNWSDIVIRVAMLGVSAGSVAQMLGYSDLGHALMAVGGACGANAHVSGGK